MTAPDNRIPGQDLVADLGLDDAQASARFDTLDIRLPYLRFAKAPN
ncbi:MAG: hypothetical protein NWR71_06180 [Paracoccaceae bacterium]|nr:hypothetical protein [Paracoccaceae bacterium]MDP5351799.1 hypothetical protein [Paracoccaceae bacterium]